MRTFSKSSKLDHVCYDIRGPIMEEADRMSQAGETILKLNIGNPAPFGFRAPQPVVEAMARQLTETEGYSDSKGLLAAREAIVKYESSKGITGLTVDDVYTGNGGQRTDYPDHAGGCWITAMKCWYRRRITRCGRHRLRWRAERPYITGVMNRPTGTPDIEDMRRKVTPPHQRHCYHQPE